MIQRIERTAVATEEAVAGGGVLKGPDNLAGIVDAKGSGALSGRGIVNGHKNVPAQQDTVQAAGVTIMSDDLAGIVDVKDLGAELVLDRVVDCGKAAASKDETVKEDVAGPERSDDLTRIVDPKCVGALGGQGIVDCCEDIHWHDTGLLSDRLACSSRQQARRPLPLLRLPGR